ncbi:MAG: sulfatase-like hydrolase/transferase [Bacteroidia bacterium]
MRLYTSIFLTFFLVLLACSPETSKQPTKPNIVYILADDLGYGDLSCYGQTHFSTPNIDQLAAAGMLFTQHYSGATVCAPSRSALLTGQHTGHTFVRGNKEVQPEGQHPLEANAFTLAEALKNAGYVTGAFGKWGLGYPGSEGDPNNQGFDEFYGYNCQRMGHNYYPYHLWHNQEKIMLTGNEGTQTGQYGPDMIHQEALNFLDKNHEKPFFLYYPSIIPHAELFAPETYGKISGKIDRKNNYDGVDEGKTTASGLMVHSKSHAAFAAMVNVLDDHVEGFHRQTQKNWACTTIPDYFHFR